MLYSISSTLASDILLVEMAVNRTEKNPEKLNEQTNNNKQSSCNNKKVLTNNAGDKTCLIILFGHTADKMVDVANNSVRNHSLRM